MNLKDIIGEATDYDKKVALEVKKPKSWCKSVSAFANGVGGLLIFGITNDNEIKGLADAEHDAEIISEQIKTRLDPIPEFHLSYYRTEDDKELILLNISAGGRNSILLLGRWCNGSICPFGKRERKGGCNRIKKTCAAWQKLFL